ncbi:STAS domain-containing protein [Methyloradius palustris]|uniref:Anti-sigma factor antagonist n=1 Tax=Methyloradius palustris TaxID=2778876 RepID=A0A8D5JS83_9PROT|nr:STAS domain-containing protein [Methyloradius palustris]BCM26186.1 anti-sigma factor antagonist [Methyloradius palustris]
MAINIVMKKDLCQLAVDGEMTIFVAQELKAALEEPLAKAREIEFDLSQITEIDSAGLQIMLMAKIESITRGTQLRFTGHSASVQDMLDLTDLGSFFGDPVVIQA